MSRTKPITRQILLAIIIGLVTCARWQHASAEGAMVNDNRPRFSIAVPDFSDSSTSDGAHGRDIAQGIASDLTATGRFVLVEPTVTVEADAFVPPFNKWRGTNAEWLVIGHVKKSAPHHEEPNRRLVEFVLWDVVKGKYELGKQYWIESEDLQRIPHILAEDILKQLTGKQDR